jgi:hypothetical protein
MPKEEIRSAHRAWWGKSSVWGLAAAVLGLVLFFNLFSSWREVLRRSAVPPVREESAPPQARAPQETTTSMATATSQTSETHPAPRARAMAPKAHRTAKVWSFREEIDDQDPFESNSSLFASQVSHRALQSEAGVQNVSYGEAPSSEPQVVVQAPVTRKQVVHKATVRVVVSPRLVATAKTESADLPIVDPTPEGVAGAVNSVAEVKRWSGNKGPYPDEHTELVQDSAALTAYWQLLASGQSMPQVDFQKEAVALIFMGARPTAGYSVSVEGVDVGPDAVTVIWHEQAPSAGSTTDQAPTRPWAMQVVPNSGKHTVFLKRP